METKENNYLPITAYRIGMLIQSEYGAMGVIQHICSKTEYNSPLNATETSDALYICINYGSNRVPVEYAKPVLRRYDSITFREQLEIKRLCELEKRYGDLDINLIQHISPIIHDYLDKIGIDRFGWIEQGLAIEKERATRPDLLEYESADIIDITECLEYWDFTDYLVLFLGQDDKGKLYLSYLNQYTEYEREERFMIEVSEHRIRLLCCAKMTIKEAFDTPENDKVIISIESKRRYKAFHQFVIPAVVFREMNTIAADYRPMSLDMQRRGYEQD